MDSNKVMKESVHVEYATEPKGAATEAPVIHTEFEQEPAPHLHSKTYLIVTAVSFLQFAQLIQLVATGAFASTVALAIGGVEISGWMLTALTMTFVVFALPVSQAADYWGRRWFLIVLALAGFVGTIVTSRAQSMGVAIVGECFVGASFATTPLSFAVVSEVLPHRHRLAGQASINAFGGFGTVFSLLVGAKLIEIKGPGGLKILWYINAGVYAAAAAACFIFYRPPPRELQMCLTTKEKLCRLDWLGYTITLCAAVLLVMGLSWAQNPYPWRNAHVLAPLIIGGLFFIVLGIYAWKINTDSFIPHGIFSRDRNLALAMASVFCEGTIFGAANVYVPFQTATLYETSSINVSLVFCIAMFGYIIWSPVAAVICYRFKQVRSLIVVGFFNFLVFAICMVTATLDSRSAIWGYQVFLGLGLSFVLNAIVAAAQLSAPAEHIAIASGLMAAIRSLGVTVSVPIYGAIFHSRISKLLPSKITAAALQNGLPNSSLPALIGDLANNKSALVVKIPGITPEIIEASVLALKQAYLESFRSVWVAVCCFSAIGVIGSLTFINPAKDLNNHIDAPAESGKALYG